MTQKKGKTGTTLNGILNELYRLASKSWSDELDLVWFEYSGHGSYVSDRSGDEVDGKDEALVPSDFRSAGLLMDDTIKRIFKSFNPKTRVISIIDACHSASVGDLKYRFVDDQMIMENKESPCKSHILSISGCLDKQTSVIILLGGENIVVPLQVVY